MKCVFSFIYLFINPTSQGKQLAGVNSQKSSYNFSAFIDPLDELYSTTHLIGHYKANSLTKILIGQFLMTGVELIATKDRAFFLFQKQFISNSFSTLSKTGGQRGKRASREAGN